MYTLLKNILFHKRSSRLITLSIGVVSFYFGFLFWYMVNRIQLLERFDIPDYQFATLLCFPFSMVVIIYKSIDSMFYNKRIVDIITMPVKPIALFKTCFLEIVQFPCGIIFTLFFSLCFISSDYTQILKFFFICIGFVCLFSFSTIFFLLLILKTCSVRIVGYVFTGIQYSGFLLVLFFSKDLILHLLFHKPAGITTSVRLYLASPAFLPLEIGGCFILLCLTYKLFCSFFYNTIYKINDFQYVRLHTSRKHIFNMRYPYLYLEKKRYIHNKDLIFYSLLKSLAASYLVLHMMKSKFDFEETILNLLIIMLLSAMNTFSVTSYSSDLEGCITTKLLPIHPHKVFRSKVFMSFLANESLIVLYLIGKAFTSPSLKQNLLLLIYGTITNYLAAFTGVFLDYLMPHYTQNKSELLHGNLTKLFVVLFCTGKVVLEIYISNRFFHGRYILITAIIINTVVLFPIYFILKLFWGNGHDRN